MNLAEENFHRLLETGMFSIDDAGRIWRHSKYSSCGTICHIEPRRAECKHSCGYLHLAIGGRKGLRAYAHRVIWQHLNGEIPDGMEINHINGIRNDNRPENLELVTNSQNKVHGHRVLGHCIGEAHWAARLTVAKVKEIRNLAKSGTTHAELARRYNVRRESIRDIIEKRNWAWLE